MLVSVEKAVLVNSDLQERRMLSAEFDMPLFYSEENPASHIFQTSLKLMEDIFIGNFKPEPAMEFFRYISAIKEFMKYLSDSEKKYAEIITPARVEEVSKRSGIPSAFIRMHVQFYINAREYILHSISEEGANACGDVGIAP